MRDRSCLKDDKYLPNANIKSISYNLIQDSDWILSILLLTIMNNQNKKKHISLQGYYAAAGIEFIKTMINIIDKREKIKEDYGDNNYHILIKYLQNCANVSIYQNLENVKDNVEASESINILMKVLNICNNNLTCVKLLDEYKLEVDENERPNPDLFKWYIKDDKEIGEEFKKFKKIKKESMDKYIEKKITSLTELTLCCGWLMGCGDINKLSKVKSVAKYFSILYKLSQDFESIDKDLKNSTNGITTNYVINFGLQESYELFMDNKQKFLEEVMLLDIYTSTIKEIMNYIENKVDTIIDETSPDLKSNISNIYTID
jgi:hypothetical protein